jgi:E3 ubiquitin-protein ligase UBR1
MPTPSGFISGLYGSPTPPSSLPFSSDAHRSLNDLFQTGHIQRAGRFSHTARAYVLRQLFHTIWQRPEWVALFGLEGEKVPQPKSLSDWLLQDENGGEKSWSLAEVQKRADARGVRMGKAPLRVVKPGRTCGKVLQRFERTYTCKWVHLVGSIRH